jgi:hypothetical protein
MVMSFEEKGYEIIRGAINPELAEFVAKEFSIMRDAVCYDWGKPIDYSNDPQAPNSFGWYSPLCLETLLVTLKDKVKEVTNKNLESAYSYGRIYYNGSVLTKHIDRESCQYSTTLCLRDDKDFPWPIYLKDFGNNEVEALLSPGDMLIYQGDKCEHWRNPFFGNEHIQCFLHYVDLDGPHAEFKFDKRVMLGLPKA